MQPSEKVVTRFAPSPTGFLHIGGIRTALFAYLWAKKNSGTFILRIEDTDKEREVPGSIAQIQRSLTWFGIDWDYGPDKPSNEFGSCIQSERLDVYRKYADILINKGLAYPDPYTAEEVNRFREQAINEKRPFLFRRHRPKTFDNWDGTKPLRFKVPEVKRYTWQDEVRGELTAGEEMLDDFILIKADGYPTYNFAHIVDDLEMGVTHVMRGEEFISSQPKFLSLYEAFGVAYPKFVTLPPIMGPDGKKKLSKRDGSKDALEYEADGYLPSALVNFLALIGWNPGNNRELFFTKQDLIETFDLNGIQKSGGAFNEDKLRWMNKEHIEKTLSETDKFKYVLSALPPAIKDFPQYSEERVAKLYPTILERVHNKLEIKMALQTGEYDWVFTVPVVNIELLKWKNDATTADVRPRLECARDLLEKADFSTPETIKKALWGYAETVGKGELLWPLRVALTGRERSPDPFTGIYMLGKTETLARLAAVCDKI